ncbi:uncharacterized protein ARMOST_16767 [Armillaria ostoyae]|uniref:Uncharacterized protein n=1 Tax=Armillaria ostoyae TaxID=47428 RepID=A0A284RVD5_ARMOS|nr:uncharacterized protein ARMOST_16154 [Armillaria ostoyae]SJL13327.1 uncharacterized protein ARMOST_16767 [Armillaria ostoyae]
MDTKLPSKTLCSASVMLYTVDIVQSALHAIVYLPVTSIDIWTSTRRKTPICQSAPLPRSSIIVRLGLRLLLLNDGVKGPFSSM